MSENICEHEIGWLSIKHPYLFLAYGEVRIGGNQTSHGQQVKMECNRSNCNSWRYAYFNKDGTFRKFGAIHNE